MYVCSSVLLPRLILTRNSYVMLVINSTKTYMVASSNLSLTMTTMLPSDYYYTLTESTILANKDR